MPGFYPYLCDVREGHTSKQAKEFSFHDPIFLHPFLSAHVVARHASCVRVGASVQEELDEGNSLPRMAAEEQPDSESTVTQQPPGNL